jgi:hypothetical protein
MIFQLARNPQVSVGKQQHTQTQKQLETKKRRNSQEMFFSLIHQIMVLTFSRASFVQTAGDGNTKKNLRHLMPDISHFLLKVSKVSVYGLNVTCHVRENSRIHCTANQHDGARDNSFAQIYWRDVTVTYRRHRCNGPVK